MLFADIELKEKVDRYKKAFGDDGELPNHKIILSDSYFEGVSELKEYAKNDEVKLNFIGFGLQDKESKNEVTYLNVIPLRENSMEEVKRVIKDRLSSGRLKTPHIILGKIDLEDKNKYAYTSEEIADLIALSKTLGEECGELVDISGHKISADGKDTYFRYNDTLGKDQIGFMGICDPKNINAQLGSQLGEE